MGTYYSVYIGPYITCSMTKTERDERICKGTKERNHKRKVFTNGENFCPQCGAVVQNVKVPLFSGPDRAVVLDKMEEMGNNIDRFAGQHFYDKQTLYLRPTAGNDECQSNDDWEVEITPEKIALELKMFREKYQAEIIELIKLYGSDVNVDICYGVINYGA